ncbi:transcription elongation factor GreA [Deinococcus sp.]|uniref:transcription elongation factor GreA n=1 Tax=Deinococcus sp. TaxID=47478 RepID=UPI0025BB11FF|nr:transcription elongation factor GreA [Deinococcus sp.]
MTKERITMTPRGYEKLLETLHFLKTTKREEISENMGRAIADGDLRESAAYDEARMQQSENEARISELESQLERSVIIEEDSSGGAGLGATVTVKDARGKEHKFELVGTYEVDVLNGKISDASPIGKALAGRKAGEKVAVQLPKGTAEFEILAVEYM